MPRGIEPMTNHPNRSKREISRRERFARIIEHEREDTKGSLEALRLQAKAWRLLTLISLFDPERGRKEARWLFMHSYPWIDGEAVRTFIAEREALAQECGVNAGVFTT
jgi:hypothetical protein